MEPLPWVFFLLRHSEINRYVEKILWYRKRGWLKETLHWVFVLLRHSERKLHCIEQIALTLIYILVMTSYMTRHLESWISLFFLKF